eukprot:992247-Prorocentrum_minimum.AAC.1
MAVSDEFRFGRAAPDGLCHQKPPLDRTLNDCAGVPVQRHAGPSEELPDLDAYDDEQRAKVVKIQATARGRAGRKQVQQKRTSALKKKKATEPLPDLEAYDDAEREKIVKIQAAARGRVARRELEKKRQKSEKKTEQVGSTPLVMNLGEMTAEDETKIVRIQAAARGRAARKQAAEKAAGGAPAVAAAEAEEEEALPNLDDYTEDERAAIVQIQAAARGRASRKQVAAKRSGAVAKEAEALPNVDDFTEEERKKI